MKIKKLVKYISHFAEVSIYTSTESDKCKSCREACLELPQSGFVDAFGNPNCEECDSFETANITNCLYEGRANSVPMALSDKKIIDIEIHNIPINYVKKLKHDHRPQSKPIIAIRVEE